MSAPGYKLSTRDPKATPNYWRVTYCYEGEIKVGHTGNTELALLIYRNLGGRGWEIEGKHMGDKELHAHLTSQEVVADGGWNLPNCVLGTSRGRKHKVLYGRSI
jgi:hypothetical protein